MSAVQQPLGLPDCLPPRLQATREPAPSGELRLRVLAERFDEAVRAIRDTGARFVTLFQAEAQQRSLAAAFALRGELILLRSVAESSNRPSRSSIGTWWPAARWAEQELLEREQATAQPADRDDRRVEPGADGEDRRVQPGADGEDRRVQPGADGEDRRVEPGADGERRLTDPDASMLDRRVQGLDVFTIPYGPVRSGVFEAIQFQIETGGEDVPRIQTRPFFKHRGMESRFLGLRPGAGVLVAERVAGIASCAYAAAFSQAVERALGVAPPPRAERWRAVHGELERIACHLDVVAKEAETTALYVGQARFQILKERIQRLRAGLTGSRFGRGAIVPGGVAFEGRINLETLLAELDAFERDLRRDRRLFLGTASMTDRLIGAGHLPRSLVEEYGGVGPLARGSGLSTDARHERPYGDYSRLGLRVVTRREGDAMARVNVRFGELAESLRILRQSIDRLRRRDGELQAELPPRGNGAACGWVEAPQGELLIWVQIRDGLLHNVHIASPSLRNWALFDHAFPKDVLTDFAFIEHSFGLTPAGADR